MFKLAMERLPDHAKLCSQSTTSRTENLPDARALLRMGRSMADHYCHSFRQVPRRIVLDIDDTFDAAHDGQQLRLFVIRRVEKGPRIGVRPCGWTESSARFDHVLGVLILKLHRAEIAELLAGAGTGTGRCPDWSAWWRLNRAGFAGGSEP